MDDVIAARVNAYDRAVADGCVRYGSRAGHKETALQRAAKELGLKTVAPVRKALERAGHMDWRLRAEELRKQARVRAQVEEARQVRNSTWNSITSNPDTLAKYQALRRADRNRHEKETTKRHRKAEDQRARRFATDRKHASRSATTYQIYRSGHLRRSDFNALDGFRVSYELSRAAAVTGIDPTREHVDGGRGWSDVAVEQAEEHTIRLKQAERCLGPEGYAFIERVAGRGETLAQAADAMGWRKLHGGGSVRYAGMRLKEAARTLRDIGFGKE